MRSSAPAASSVAVRYGQLAIDRVRRLTANRGSSPFRLRSALVLTVVVALAFAVLGAYGVGKRQSKIRAARHAATQLIAVQGIRVSLVQADAIASQSYLAAGGDTAQRRTDYEAAMNRATAALVGAALQLDLGPAATDALTKAAQSLTRYTGLVEQARANNRQGFPVGAAYQREANTVVTETILPALQVVEDGQRAAVNGDLAAAHRAGAWLVVIGWLLVAVLVVGAVWLALRFRRIVNVPIAIAVLALLAMLILGGAAQARAVSRADAAVGGALTDADLVAQARAAAYDARSQEALTLINRGNGAANEAAWVQSKDLADAALTEMCDRNGNTTCEVRVALRAYATGHEAIRAADDKGDWDTAVKTSLGTVDPSTVVTPFKTFDDTSRNALDDRAAVARTDLAAAADGLSLMRVLVVVDGVFVALVAASGYAQRLREYR